MTAEQFIVFIIVAGGLIILAGVLPELIEIWKGKK